MKKTSLRLLTAAAVLSLAACHRGGSGSAPSGQVVAKVGGDEITQRELNAEMGGFTSQDPNMTKRMQQAALDAIVNRKIVAAAARDAGVAKSPEYQLARQRADELMLAQAYEQQIAAKLPRPTPQEVSQYIEQHPNTFAQRKIYLVDQIQMPGTLDQQIANKIKPLHSMDDIEQVLIGAGLDYSRAPGTIDARAMSPDVIAKIAALPSSEPFVLPNNGGISISQVKEARTVPFTGQAAMDFAERAIMSERAQKAVADRIAQLRKSAGQVQYQQGYGPQGTQKTS